MAEQWTLLTNHGRVLLIIAGDPDVRLRDVAASVGITERSVQMIVADLEGAGYITRERRGRRNHYVVHSGEELPAPARGRPPRRRAARSSSATVGEQLDATA